MIPKVLARLWNAFAVCLFGAAIVLAVRALLALMSASVGMVWGDMWAMLDELKRFREGQVGLAYLWQPYWGHRIVLPRLLFLLDERVFRFSNYPLIVVSVACQFVSFILLCVLEWRAIGPNIGRRLVAVGITTYLLFSALQVENFVSGMCLVNTLCYALTICAILLLGGSNLDSKRRLFFFEATIACAVLGSLTAAPGLLVWPILVVEAVLLRVAKGRVWTLTLVGAAAFAIYFTHYNRDPELGMGIAGVLTRPLAALRITALFLGGPVALDSVPGAEGVGLLGLIATALVAVNQMRQRTKFTRARMMLLCITAFAAMMSVGIAFGRISPDWLANRGSISVLPSRYFTPGFLFWASLTAGVLAGWKDSAPSRAAAVVTSVGCALILFSTVRHEEESAFAWKTFCGGLDASSSALLLGIKDDERLSNVSNQLNRMDPWVAYLRQHRLSLFSQERARWPGRPVAELARELHLICAGAVDLSKDLGGGALRVAGHVPDEGFGFSRDVLFAGSDGLVVGLGRTFGVRDLNHPGSEHFWGYVRSNGSKYETCRVVR